MKIELKLRDILGLLEQDFELEGKDDILITGIAPIDSAEAGDLTFIQEKRYAAKLQQTRASAIVVPTSFQIPENEAEVIIRVENPSKALSSVCASVENLLFPPAFSGIAATAELAEPVSLGEGVSVGSFSNIDAEVSVGEGTFIGRRVSIGTQCKIGRQVMIADNVVIGPHTEIGDGCRIHSGAVIGRPGFGYDFNKSKGKHERIPQIGRVSIGSHVDIGANTTIDRSRLGVTKIGNGTKIDNLVQVAHNVEIGEHCIICSQVGISGTVKIGDYVVLAGQVGVADHIEIASMTQVGGQSGIMSSVKKPGSKVLGSPAFDYGLAAKAGILQKRLPEFFKSFNQLEKRVVALEKER